MHAAPKAASVWQSEFAQAAFNGCRDPTFGRCRLNMIGRITQAADFKRVLKASCQVRSPHFAVHHLASAPSVSKKTIAKSGSRQLSTSAAAAPIVTVDDSAACLPGKALQHNIWLGMVIPKRHAKRAVTRTLLKRQIKAAMDLQVPVAPGLWVVRLRATFDRAVYVSAASKALSAAAREELTCVLSSAAQRFLAVQR